MMPIFLDHVQRWSWQMWEEKHYFSLTEKKAICISASSNLPSQGTWLTYFIICCLFCRCTMWTSVVPSSPDAKVPTSRSKHASVLHGPNLYLLGGRNGNVPLKDFWKYHIGKQETIVLWNSNAFFHAMLNPYDLHFWLWSNFKEKVASLIFIWLGEIMPRWRLLSCSSVRYHLWDS